MGRISRVAAIIARTPGAGPIDREGNVQLHRCIEVPNDD
jgi:hypothetical protein